MKAKASKGGSRVKTQYIYARSAILWLKAINRND